MFNLDTLQEIMKGQDLIQPNLKGETTTLTLHNPKALNSLSQPLIRGLQYCLDHIQSLTLVIRGNSKAFCAGGDVKFLYHHMAEDKIDQAVEFCKEELKLDFSMHELSKHKHTIAIWEGVVMGGGVGLSFSCGCVVATGSTLFAMPQCRIGYFPDVGTSYLFKRLGKKGLFLGVTGYRVKGRQVYDLDIATHYIEKQPYLDQLQQKDNQPQKQKVLEEVEELDDSDYPQFREGLEKLSGGVGQRVQQHLKENDPFSMAFTFYYLKRAMTKDLTYQECIARDDRAMPHFVKQWPDFKEGIRALLIEKDNQPTWQPCPPLHNIKSLAQSF